MTRTLGTLYQDTADLDVAAIAKLVRRDIKVAVDGGGLPAARYSVRISRFSGGQSLDVTISGQPFDAFETVVDYQGWERRHYTAEAQALVEHVKRIVSAYNYDGSDPMTDYYDVRFYSNVSVS